MVMVPVKCIFRSALVVSSELFYGVTIVLLETPI